MKKWLFQLIHGTPEQYFNAQVKRGKTTREIMEQIDPQIEIGDYLFPYWLEVLRIALDKLKEEALAKETTNE